MRMGCGFHTLRVAVLSSVVVLGGCLPRLPARETAVSPQMRPEIFFAGRSEGRGRLALRGREPRAFRVTSTGTSAPDGSFRLEQTVAFDDGEVNRRTWRIR